MTIVDQLSRLAVWQDENPLRAWRERHRISMRKAAPLIGTNFNSVQDWEQGQYAPRDESMEKIAEVTGVTREDWDEWLERKPHLDI